MSQAVYGLLTLGLCYLLACRIDKMVRGVTRPAVFWQHAVLGVASMGSFLAGFTELAPWRDVIFAAGVLVFFLFSLDRWRVRAPKDTKLTEMPPEVLRHVVGGKK